MNEAQEAQFKKVIDRLLDDLLDDNKLLRDLVGWQAAENERLREALHQIAGKVSQSDKPFDGDMASEIARAALGEGK